MTKGKITLIIGSMMSSKSSMLLTFVERAFLAGKKPVIIRPVTDTRDYISRKKQKPGCPMYTVQNRLLDLGNTINEYDVICIDEGQFIDKIGEDAHVLALCGKHVIITALAGDSDMKPWKNVSELIPFVEDIIKTDAVCCHCKDDSHGTFTLYDGVKTKQVEIGDETDNYRAMCRECWNNLYNSGK